MKLTNAVGQVVASYTYGTYGELLSGDTTLTHFLYNGRCGVSTDANGLYYMRQRYYNAEIKRFVNQDILAGSLDNSQSLNRYSYVQGNPVSYTDPFGLSPLSGLFSDTNFTHCLLGLLSCIPGPVGAVASVADAAVYFFIDKDYGMAALSLMSAASMGLGSIATNIAKTGKMAFTAKLLGTTSNLLSNAASFGMSASAGMDMAYSMYEKYGIYGEQIDGSTIGEAAGLGMSILGCAISGRGIADDARKMGNMLGDTGFVNRMKGEVTEFAQGVKSAVESVAAQAKAGFNRFVTEETGAIVIGGTKGGSTSNISRTRWGAEHGKGNVKHNNAIETELDTAFKDGATDLRKNRVQRDVNGNRVYATDGTYTRPDASYVLNGKRYNTNYISNYMLDDIDELNRELDAFRRMVEADPDAIIRLEFDY